MATLCQAWTDRSLSSPCWSLEKLRHRAAQGPIAAKGQSWVESLAMPTQHPINAGKVGFLGFKSQKL